MPCDNAGVYLEKSIVRAAFEYSIRENVSLSGFLGDECVTMRHTPEIQVDCHCEAHLHAVLHSSIQSFGHSFKVAFIHSKFHSSTQSSFLPCCIPFLCSFFHFIAHPYYHSETIPSSSSSSSVICSSLSLFIHLLQFFCSFLDR